jgi:shikimate 5-dehydrogenase
MIDGNTILIAHIGYPTATFKAPMIYNPYFQNAAINAAVMTMGVKGEDYADLLRPLFKLTNIRGALITMPHKVATVRLLDEVEPYGLSKALGVTHKETCGTRRLLGGERT